MKGAWEEFNILREVTNNARDDIWLRMNEQIQHNTRRVCDLQDSSEKSARALELLQVSSGGLLAFAFLDRLTGQWSVMDAGWATSLSNLVLSVPYAWTFFSLLTWGGVASAFLLLLRRYARLAKGTISLRLKIHQRIVLQNFHEYIKTKVLEGEVHKVVDGNHIIRVVWTEEKAGDWGGFGPTVTIELDEATQFMLTVGIRYNRTQARKYLAFNSEELMRQLFEEMHVEKVFVDPNYIPKPKELEDEDPDMK